MENRKPRPSRFGTESAEARLARLRETAPTLVSSRKLRLYALFGSVLMFLTVAAFYFAMQIYDAVTRDRVDVAMIEVDQAPPVKASETEKVLARIKEQEARQDAAFEEQLKALQEIDLLKEPENKDR